MLDLAILVRRTLHRREARGDISDLFALVADALEVRDGLDDCDNHPQVTGRRRAGREDAAALLVDGDFHVVDLVVVHRHRLAERAVALDERGDRLVELLLHEAAHSQHFAANPLEVFVEAARDVVAEIRGFHQLASPAARLTARAIARDHSRTVTTDSAARRRPGWARVLRGTARSPRPR